MTAMPTAIMTSKGQITIPLAVRQKLGLDTGDRVEFIDLGNGQFGLIPATEDISALKGAVRRPARTVTVETMNQAIRKRAARR
jgi:antitoxin PrlF